MVRADLEDVTLVAVSYKVEVVLKPPGCDDPADWGQHGWTLPDHADVLAPLEWPAAPLACQRAGLWTIEMRGQASPFALGGLRVRVSER